MTAAVAALIVAACSSSSKSVTSPTSARCPVQLTQSPSTIDAGGGSGQIAIAVNRDCTWEARSEADWITLTGATSGQGESSISYSASPNAVVSVRRGAVVVNEQRLEMAQSAAACRHTLSAQGGSAAAEGGSLTVRVAAPATCRWTALSQVSWVRVEGGREGDGEGVVTLSVEPNSGPAREGAVAVAGQTYSVSQSGVPGPGPGPQPGCDVAVSPEVNSFAAAGGEGTSRVSTAGPACAWIAISNVPWITVVAGSGTGPGLVRYVVAVNAGAARTGTLNVAGSLITVSQQAAATPGCTLTASPLAESFTASGGEGTVRVTASSPNCSWSAASSVPWMTVATGAATGSGDVRYTVAANTGGSRTGTLSVAGATISVTQGAAAAPTCELTASPLTESFPVNGGAGTVRVTASGPNCTWNAASAVPWITVAASGGTGTGDLRYAVAANTGGARTGSLSVAGATISVSQAGVASTPCSYNVSPLSGSFDANGGDGSARIQTASGCAWTAVSNAGWISVATGSGSGNADVRYTVARNTGGSRTGTLRVAGATITVTQAEPCEYDVSPRSQSFDADGGDDSIRIRTAGSCAWTVVSSAAWIRPASGSGTGNGNVRYDVLPNTGAARSGTLTVAGTVVTISQEAVRPTVLNGRIEGLSGSCPNVTFTVDRRLVRTNSSTAFDERCDRVRNNRDATVWGVPQSDGSVLASRVAGGR